MAQKIRPLHQSQVSDNMLTKTFSLYLSSILRHMGSLSMLRKILIATLFAFPAYAAEITDLDVTDASNTARFPEGMAPGTVNDSARALEGILARWEKDINGSLASAGSANAYTIASPNRTIAAYYDGLVLQFEANFTNTGAATLNVSAVGAKNIVKNGNSQALDSGDIQAGQKIVVVFDNASDVWQLAAGGGDLKSSNNLADVASAFSSYANLVTPSIGTARGTMMALSSTNVPGPVTIGAANTVLKSDGSDPSFGALVTTDLPDGTVVQHVSVTEGELITGADQIPSDDTIPQNTEGNQFMSLAITPQSATNTLIIEVIANFAHDSAGNNFFTGALFQDTTANALAAQSVVDISTDNSFIVSLRHIMTAGTTSSTTFALRAGSADGGTTSLNGVNESRLMGGVMSSSISILEIKGS